MISPHAVAPRTELPTVPIGHDTHLLRQVRAVPGTRLWVGDHSMVITGAEPVVVATATAADHTTWLESVFAVVEPTDVRWIYVSNDRLDHTDGLARLLAAYPHATLVVSRAALHRLPDAATVPLERCRLVDDGESFHAGDRDLLSLRAPLWSMSGGRSLLDQRTGIYWAAETFGCLLPNEPVDTVAELDAEAWATGMVMFAHLLAPWLTLVDHGRFAALCHRTQALGMTTIAASRSPLIDDTSIDQAFQLLRDLPASPPPPIWAAPAAPANRAPTNGTSEAPTPEEGQRS
jgi:flavorubredoxin